MNKGDILTYESGETKWILIFDDWYEPYEGHMHYFALSDCNGEFYGPGTCFMDDQNSLRQSTEEECTDLLNRMLDNGYMWDDNNKKVIKL